MRPYLALALLLLCACAPKVEPAEIQLLGLDCTQPFEAQAARLVAQPGLQAAPKDYAEPYHYYSSEDGRTSYLITLKGAPGNPAFMMQKAGGGTVITPGCPYGDPKGYQQLLAYLESLKVWTRKK